VCTRRDEERGQNVVSKITANGGESIFVKTDVTQAAEVKNCIDVAVEKYRKIDSLINNAGIVLYRSCEEMSESEVDSLSVFQELKSR